MYICNYNFHENHHRDHHNLFEQNDQNHHHFDEQARWSLGLQAQEILASQKREDSTFSPSEGDDYDYEYDHDNDYDYEYDYDYDYMIMILIMIMIMATQKKCIRFISGIRLLVVVMIII